MGNRRCDICGEKPGIHMDHEKLTDRVRGCLCARCNHMMHVLDTPGLLEKCIAYHSSPPMNAQVEITYREFTNMQRRQSEVTPEGRAKKAARVKVWRDNNREKYREYARQWYQNRKVA